MHDDAGLHKRKRRWGDEIDRGQHEYLWIFQNIGKQAESQPGRKVIFEHDNDPKTQIAKIKQEEKKSEKYDLASTTPG